MIAKITMFRLFTKF